MEIVKNVNFLNESKNNDVNVNNGSNGNNKEFIKNVAKIKMVKNCIDKQGLEKMCFELIMGIIIGG